MYLQNGICSCLSGNYYNTTTLLCQPSWPACSWADAARVGGSCSCSGNYITNTADNGNTCTCASG
jgi:hypothetical protein